MFNSINKFSIIDSLPKPFDGENSLAGSDKPNDSLKPSVSPFRWSPSKVSPSKSPLISYDFFQDKENRDDNLRFPTPTTSPERKKIRIESSLSNSLENSPNLKLFDMGSAAKWPKITKRLFSANDEGNREVHLVSHSSIPASVDVQSQVDNFTSENVSEKLFEQYLKLGFQQNKWMDLLEKMNPKMDVNSVVEQALKRFGHIFSLGGEILYNKREVHLEGLDAYDGCLIAFESYLHSSIFKDKIPLNDQPWIRASFLNGIRYSLDDFSVFSIEKEFKSGNPVFFPTGWSTHTVGFLLWKIEDTTYLAVCNRGLGGRINNQLGINGIVFYASKNDESIDRDFFDYVTFLNPERYDPDCDKKFQEEIQNNTLFENYDFSEIECTVNKSQKTGNCSYIAGKLLIRAFLHLYYTKYCKQVKSTLASRDMKEWDFYQRAEHLKQFLDFKKYSEKNALPLEKDDYFFLLGSVIYRFVNKQNIEKGKSSPYDLSSIPSLHQKALRDIDTFLRDENLYIEDMIHESFDEFLKMDQLLEGSFVIIDDGDDFFKVIYNKGQKIEELFLYAPRERAEEGYSLVFEGCTTDGEIFSYSDLVKEAKTIGVNLTYPVSTLYL